MLIVASFSFSLLAFSAVAAVPRKTGIRIICYLFWQLNGILSRGN